MARIMVDDRPTFVRRSEEKRSMSSNRANQELSVGLEAKKYLDSFFTALNDAPSEVCTYYQTHVGESSFSNNLNSQKKVDESTMFNKILEFVTWGPKVDKELEKREDDEREAAYTPTEQERVILQGTIRPVVGDHIKITAQGKQARLYQVTNVDPQKLIDKPIYLISMSPSPSFSLESIEKNVIKTYRFIFGNIGSGRKTILSEQTYDRIVKSANTLRELNKMYVNTFYDEVYDILRYRGSGFGGAINFVGCKALREFQDQTGVLRYGEDLNTLFTNYPVVSNDDLKDYKMSYINKILKRKIRTKAESPTPLNIPCDPYNHSLKYELEFKRRDDYNEENEMMLDSPLIDNFESMYNYSTKFFISNLSDFSILTHFRKSNISLNELNSRPADISTKDMEFYIMYEPKAKILLYVLDLYMQEKYEDIVNLDIFDDYVPSNNNIDDYLILPLVIYIISEAIETIEKDDLIVSF